MSECELPEVCVDDTMEVEYKPKTTNSNFIQRCIKEYVIAFIEADCFFNNKFTYKVVRDVDKIFNLNLDADSFSNEFKVASISNVICDKSLYSTG